MKASKRYKLPARPLASGLIAIGILTCLGMSCGAPTAYEQQKAWEKTPCEEECAKAHRNGESQARANCVRVCEAQKEIEESRKRQGRY